MQLATMSCDTVCDGDTRSNRVRIISLIASSTEAICALGLEEFLVGRSHECDYPPRVSQLPVCTKPRFDVSGSSREIDERVKSLQRESLVKDALGVYEVFPDRLRELQPTHIVTQAQCEVCAVSLRDVERAVAEVAECQATIISLQPNSMADFWADICRLASGLGRTGAGVRLVANLQARVQEIEARTRPLRATPRVACIEWADPLMAAGNWMPELVQMAGGENLFGEPGETFTVDEVRGAGSSRPGCPLHFPLRLRYAAHAAGSSRCSKLNRGGLT